MFAEATVNLAGLKKFTSGLESDPIMVAASVKWGDQYNRFMIARFRRYSAGGGNWAPLKQETIRQKSANRSRILIEEGDMLSGIKATASPVAKPRSLAVRAGITSTGYHTGAGVSIRELVSIHHFGRGRVPRRQIVVVPPQRVVNAMVNVAAKALRKLSRKHNR